MEQKDFDRAGQVEGRSVGNSDWKEYMCSGEARRDRARQEGKKVKNIRHWGFASDASPHY